VRCYACTYLPMQPLIPLSVCLRRSIITREAVCLTIMMMMVNYHYHHHHSDLIESPAQGLRSRYPACYISQDLLMAHALSRRTVHTYLLYLMYTACITYTSFASSPPRHVTYRYNVIHPRHTKPSSHCLRYQVDARIGT